MKGHITMSLIVLVGTPGLGYPLLLCLGKGLVVILNYALMTDQPDPCGPEPYSPGKRPGPTPRLGKVRWSHVSRRRWPSAKTAGGPGPPREYRTPAGSRTPYTIRTPQQGGTDTPPGAGPEPPRIRRCGRAHGAAWLPLEDSPTYRIKCGRRKCALPQQSPRRLLLGCIVWLHITKAHRAVAATTHASYVSLLCRLDTTTRLRLL